MKKQAFWFRYPDKGGFSHIAVIAGTLEVAFKKLEAQLGVDPLEAKYLNRQIDVIE